MSISTTAPRLRILDRLLLDLAIPTSDVWVIDVGTVAVNPVWANQIRAKYASQPWYIAWLDRQYRASEVSMGSHLTVILHKGPGTSAQPSAPALYAESTQTLGQIGVDTQIEMTIAGGLAVRFLNLWYNPSASSLGSAGGGVSGLGYCWDPTGFNGFSTIELNQLSSRLGGLSLNVGSVVNVGAAHQPFSLTPWDPTGGYFANAGLVPVVSKQGGFSTVSSNTIPNGRTDWLLVSGPSVLTRCEIYPNGFEWRAASSVESAELLTETMKSVTDRNELNKLRIKRDLMLARGSDALIWVVPGSMDPYKMYGPTRGHASDMAAQSGVVDGMDFDRAKSRLLAGELVTLVASTEAAGTLLDPYPDIATTVVASVSPGVDTLVPGYQPAVSLGELSSLVTGTRMTGRTWSLDFGDEMLYSADDLLLVAKIKTAIETPLGETDLRVTTTGENGAVAAGMIQAMFGDATKSQTDVIKAMLTPGYLDILMFNR